MSNSLEALTFARVGYRDGVSLVRIDGDNAVVLIEESNHPAADVLREALLDGVDLSSDGPQVDVANLEFLAPIANPSKIICAGLNYVDHATESGVEPPTKPLLFAKFSNALVGGGQAVTVPASLAGELDYEGELAVVMGRRCRDVDADSALDYVFGYTIADDLSARDAQFSDGQWLRGKSADGFCPLGPAIVPASAIPDPQTLRIVTQINGETVQDGSTADMIFPVAELIAYCSRFFTLEPGDLLLTGTPPGVGFARKPPLYLGDGDLVEITIDGLGLLSHRIAIADSAV